MEKPAEFAHTLARRLAFGHYLRTGAQLAPDAFLEVIEHKFNPYHDPEDGRFTFAPGGGSLTPRRSPAPAPKQSRPTSTRYPVRIELPGRYPIRNEMPQAQPMQGDPKKPKVAGNQTRSQVICFPHNADLDLPDEVVTKANVLSEAIRTATGHQIHVTSGRRGPARQAEAMYGNYLDGSAKPYRNELASKEVREAYRDGVRRGLSRNQVISQMANVLSRQNSRGIFISKHMRSDAIDIRMPPENVVRAIRNSSKVQSVLVEDDHLHIQFK